MNHKTIMGVIMNKPVLTSCIKIVKLFIYFFLLISLNLFSLTTFTKAEEVSQGPVPDWVKKRTINVNTFLLDEKNSGGIQFLLDDSQAYYLQKKPLFYKRYVVRLHSLQAIEEMGKLGISYYPAYQSYNIHHLTVWRGGKAINMLKTAKVIFKNQEVVKNSPAYEGIKTIAFYLADIRQGDVLDFSFTITGQNTAFANRVVEFTTSVRKQTTHNVFQRYTVPKNEPLNIIYLHGHKKPSIMIQQDDRRVYEWEWKEIEGVSDVEANTPVWYVQFPSIAISDFRSWAEVRVWAQKLFSFPGKKPKSVKSLAKKITHGTRTDKARIKKILAFMQSQIRYVGIEEIGRNGYRPFKPGEVLDRRYGDCKDQSVLLQALLKAVGIKSWPALVNSNGDKYMQNFGISPYAFNHAIVKVKTKNNIYWIDPTLPLIKGQIADLTPPRYEKALVLDKESVSLANIPLEERDSNKPHIQVTDYYNFPGGLLAPATWTRQTKFRGDAARIAKLTIENMGMRKFSNSLLKSRARFYEDLANNKTTRVEENKDSLTLIEDYKMTRPGIYDKSGDITEFDYRPANIADLLIVPQKTKGRKTPFAIPYPARRQTIVKLNVPDAVFRPFRSEISSPYYYYLHHGEYDGKIFRMTYIYETRQDHVPPEDIKEYAKEIEKIYEEIYLNIYTFGNSGKRKTFVSQSVAKTNPAEKKSGSLTTRQLFDNLIKRGPEAGKTGRQEVSRLLEKKDLTPRQKKYMVKKVIYYFSSQGQKEETLYYLDLLVKTYGSKDKYMLIKKAGIYQKLGRYKKSIDILNNIHDMGASSNHSLLSGDLFKLLREDYWRLQDFNNLMPVLEQLVKNHPRKWQYFRELDVVYNLLGKKGKQKKLRQTMSNMGYTPKWLNLRAGPRYARNPRLIFRAHPVYPKKATPGKIQGYVKVSFTITRQGKTRDCRVINAKPVGYFEEAACTAIGQYYYYPRDAKEPDVDVPDFEKIIRFELE